MQGSSELPGFYKLSVEERLKLLRELAGLTEEESKVLGNTGGLPSDVASRMIENVVGGMTLPLGMATNFLINGKDYVVPMALEEPSVVAAASNAAKIARVKGGFKVTNTGPVMIGQIQTVGVPDPRLAALAKLYNSARIVPASVRFTDIAGLVRGASQGQGLGNQFLAHIRETDAICQVVRVFADPDVAHVDGDISPERDIETVVTELILADLQTLEKALPRLAKETKFAKDAERARVAQTAEAAEKLLFTGVTLWAGAAAAGIDLAALRELQLLTAKPFLYVFNCDIGELGDTDLRERLSALVSPAEAVFLDAKTEADLTELPEDEAAELLAEAGLGEPGLVQLAQAGFRALGLQTFLTAGPKEARAWTIKAGATAPQAAGVIHSDFQRGFIKAEVISYDDLIAAGSVAAARAAGKARIEGKDYIMRDGDVVEFRFNV